MSALAVVLVILVGSGVGAFATCCLGGYLGNPPSIPNATVADRPSRLWGWAAAGIRFTETTGVRACTAPVERPFGARQ